MCESPYPRLSDDLPEGAMELIHERINREQAEERERQIEGLLNFLPEDRYSANFTAAQIQGIIRKRGYRDQDQRNALERRWHFLQRYLGRRDQPFTEFEWS